MKKSIYSILSLLLLATVVGCEKEFEYYTQEENSDKANTVLYYTTTDGSVANVRYDSRADVVSNIYQNGKGKIVLRGKLAYTPDNLFQYCSTIKSVTIPEGITDIGVRSFEDCYNLAEVSLPKSIENLYSYAFSNTKIKSLVLPENVEWIADYALYASSLEYLYVKAVEPPQISWTARYNFIDDVKNIYVPQSAVNAYKSATGWDNYASKIVAYDFVNNRPAAKEVVTGKYHFLSYVNSDNQKLYNTMTVEKTGNGTYEISNLLFPNSVKWMAVHDVENSCLVLSGNCSFVNPNQEYKTLDNGFMRICTFSETRAYFVSSWPSKSLHYAEDYDGTTPCVINVNPNTGLLESFDTYLAEEVFEYDNTTDEIGEHLGYSLQVVEPTIYQGEKPYSYQSSPHHPLNVSAPKKSFTARKAVELEAIVDNDSE